MLFNHVLSVTSRYIVRARDRVRVVRYVRQEIYLFERTRTRTARTAANMFATVCIASRGFGKNNLAVRRYTNTLNTVFRIKIQLQSNLSGTRVEVNKVLKKMYWLRRDCVDKHQAYIFVGMDAPSDGL